MVFVKQDMSLPEMMTEGMHYNHQGYAAPPLPLVDPSSTNTSNIRYRESSFTCIGRHDTAVRTPGLPMSYDTAIRPPGLPVSRSLDLKHNSNYNISRYSTSRGEPSKLLGDCSRIDNYKMVESPTKIELFRLAKQHNRNDSARTINVQINVQTRCDSSISILPEKYYKSESARVVRNKHSKVIESNIKKEDSDVIEDVSEMKENDKLESSDVINHTNHTMSASANMANDSLSKVHSSYTVRDPSIMLPEYSKSEPSKSRMIGDYNIAMETSRILEECNTSEDVAKSAQLAAFLYNKKLLDFLPPLSKLRFPEVFNESAKLRDFFNFNDADKMKKTKQDNHKLLLTQRLHGLSKENHSADNKTFFAKVPQRSHLVRQYTDIRSLSRSVRLSESDPSFGTDRNKVMIRRRKSILLAKNPTCNRNTVKIPQNSTSKNNVGNKAGFSVLKNLQEQTQTQNGV